MQQVFNFIASVVLVAFAAGAHAQAQPHHDKGHARHASTARAAVALPGDSLHRLQVPLTDQDGERISLATFAGSTTVVSMFYGDCKMTCPVILENAKRTIVALSGKRDSRVNFLLVSLNPGVDTAASLKKLHADHQLPARVRLAVSDTDAHTRQLAAVLGIKYRRMPDGQVNHNTRFVIVDPQGRAIKTSDRLAIEPDPELLAALR